MRRGLLAALAVLLAAWLVVAASYAYQRRALCEEAAALGASAARLAELRPDDAHAGAALEAARAGEARLACAALPYP